MQKKKNLQLPSISLSKASLFLLVLFSLSACDGSSGESSNTSGDAGTSEGVVNTPVPLSTALDNFKTVATDAGLTDQ